jgi:hypothetical protein
MIGQKTRRQAVEKWTVFCPQGQVVVAWQFTAWERLEKTFRLRRGGCDRVRAF